MKLTSLLGIVGVIAATQAAQATIIDDPLHGFCDGSNPVGACVDNGTNTPLGDSDHFGFTISPGPQIGDLTLVILLPDNYSLPPSGFSMSGSNFGPDNTGSVSGTATLFSSTAWDSGSLDVYLGLNPGGSPNNPIGAFLPTTQALDPGSTGFYAYMVDLGTTRLPDNNHSSDGPTFDTIADLSGDIGAYIVGFCAPVTASASFGDTTLCGSARKPFTVATANSGALLVNGDRIPPDEVPEPSVLALLSIALLGFGGTTLRRRS